MNSFPQPYRKNSIATVRKSIVGMLIVVSSLSGCTEKEPPKDDTPKVHHDLNVSVTKPVDRDFDAIKRSGVIRMITRYSSNTYFLQQGVERGFEYELVKKFAKENDLALEVVVIGENDNPYDMLNSGEGDLIAANYTITPERKQYVQFTRPYNIVDQVVALPEDLGQSPSSLQDLSDVTISVRRNSSYYHRLMELKRNGYQLNVNLVPDDMDTETLLYEVMNGTYEATVADDNIFQAASKYMGGLTEGPKIARNDTIAWAIRKNADGLKTQMNRFLYKHFRLGGPDEPPKRSAFLNILRKRYFKEGPQIAEYYNPERQFRTSGILSPYDDLIKSIADSADLDWKMLTSVIAQESKFNPNSRSWAGAIGLMQILPRFSTVEESQLYDPETNIREGVRILNEHLDHYAYMDTTNRWAFALATYNAGEGHIADARRLAIDLHRNPNNWDNAEDALLKLMQRKYYQNARYGFCRGIETVRYVREIMNRYETYETILALAEKNRKKQEGIPNIIGLKMFN